MYVFILAKLAARPPLCRFEYWKICLTFENAQPLGTTSRHTPPFWVVGARRCCIQHLGQAVPTCSFAIFRFTKQWHKNCFPRFHAKVKQLTNCWASYHKAKKRWVQEFTSASIQPTLAAAQTQPLKAPTQLSLVLKPAPGPNLANTLWSTQHQCLATTTHIMQFLTELSRNSLKQAWRSLRKYSPWDRRD